MTSPMTTRSGCGALLDPVDDGESSLIYHRILAETSQRSGVVHGILPAIPRTSVIS
jgi:hypothetical protein